MRVCICGLWHLGSVTAACISEHFETVAFDPDPQVIANLSSGVPPLFEPGLEDALRRGLDSGKLRFTSDRAEAVRGSDIVWITYDTPVDENDVADVDYVEREVEATFPHLRDGSIVLISSQMPVGSTRRLWRKAGSRRDLHFACSPENLRLGKALEVFRQPDRIIAGVDDSFTQEVLTRLFQPFTNRLEWMRIESAEMTKHALNAFLATSVTFINEIASICEQTGADAKEVERGLKTEVRIGPRAYLGPGGAFAGGTLARDIAFLTAVAKEHDVPAVLIPSVRASNEEHKNWPRRKLLDTLGTLEGRVVALLGLTYKPGTDTLRRSSAVELAQWISQLGGTVRAYDPAVPNPPAGLPVEACSSAEEALKGADAAVVSTEWPAFRDLQQSAFAAMRGRIVLDANRFLAGTLENAPGIHYVAVGKAKESL